jgi:phage repressor protein C with HTH and peptisase S24 domain
MVLRDASAFDPALHRGHSKLLVIGGQRAGGPGHAAELRDDSFSNVLGVGHAYIYARRVRVVNVESVRCPRVSMLPMLDNSTESITARVRSLRKRAGLSMDAFARGLGMRGASSVQRYEDPTRYAGGYLKRDLVDAMARVLVSKGNPPISRDEVWDLAGPEFSPTPLEKPNATIGQKIPSTIVQIPLYGQAVGGVDGEFVLNEGNRLADIVAPPSVANVSGAYAVTVSGESMEPRYFDGEVVFVHPKRRPVKGDFVVAQIHNPNEGPPLAYVKRLVRFSEAGLVLEQYNPPKELRFEYRAVVTVNVIVMGGDKLIDNWY